MLAFALNHSKNKVFGNHGGCDAESSYASLRIGGDYQGCGFGDADVGQSWIRWTEVYREHSGQDSQAERADSEIFF